MALPFSGRWLVQNSPARRIPSHGTDLLGERYAIDFVGVTSEHHTARSWDWRTLLSVEPVERFVSFGRSILAPVSGTIVTAHDAEPDHVARRSQLALLPYMLGQRARLKEGIHAIAGNHIVIAVPEGDAFVALVHLRAGSLRVGVGATVAVGQPIAECGNSGNSTQPHVHIQAMDRQDLAVAQGIPTEFRRFREWPARGRPVRDRDRGVPDEGSVVEPIPA